MDWSELELAEEMDWSCMPSDLLISILDLLSCAADHARFGAVCRSWRSAAAAGRRRAHLPYLVVGSSAALSLAGEKPLPLGLPEGSHCIGSSNGWLFVTGTDATPHLLNPFSLARVDLPPLPEFATAGRDKTFRFRLSRPNSMPNFHAFRVCLSSPDPDSVVVVIHDSGYKLAFARPGDLAWTNLYDRRGGGDGGGSDSGGDFFDDLTYREGKFYVFSRETLLAIEIVGRKAPKLTSLVSLCHPGGIMCQRYLASLPSGELLLVATDPYRSTVDGFKIFKINPSNEQLNWVEVESLSGLALFLTSQSLVAVSSSDVAQVCQGNSIYFSCIDLDNDHVVETIKHIDFEKKSLQKDVLRNYMHGRPLLLRFPLFSWIMPNL